MKIQTIEILEIAIPFRLQFRHALASRSVGENVLVRIRSDDGQAGYGECVPREYVTSETLDSVQGVLRDRLAPPFVGADFSSFREVTDAVEKNLVELPRDRHAAFCALELALLDLAGKVFDCSAGSVLGPVVHRSVRYSGIVSADGPEAVVKTARRFRDAGFRSVKVKVGHDADVDRKILEGVRETMGEDCSLRIDANCAWKAEEALGRLESYAPLRLDGVEQPLARTDVTGLSWLTERSPVPVIVDESLASLEDARELAEKKACHCFNIRISKCGGLANSARIRDLGAAAGIQCMLGAQVGETALLSAAGRHFATRTAEVLFLEGSYANLLLEQDIGTEDLTIGPGGEARTLEKPGLGVEVDEEVLGKYIRRSLGVSH